MVSVHQGICESLVRLLRTNAGKKLLSSRSVSRVEMRLAAEAEQQIWLWDEAERTLLNEPIHEGVLPDEIRETMGIRLIDAPFVCECSGITLVGPQGMALTSTNRFLLEQSLGSLNLLARDVAATLSSGEIPASKSPDTAEHTFETAVSLAGPWNPSYFHWFSDYLPRLAGVEYYRRETGREPTLILPPSPTKWMQRSLERMGYDQWTEWSGEPTYVESLVVPTVRRETQLYPPTDRSWVYSPSAYQWVRDQILGDPPDNKAPSRIYISRNDADSRRVTNEPAVVDALNEYGFQSYELTGLSFDEQVDLFARAEAIVAPHGAGLTNLLWSESATVVELFGEYENNSYYTLATSLGHKYAVLKGTPVGTDIKVDLNKLRTMLDRVLR